MSKWTLTECELPTDRGLYQVYRMGDGWSARFLPADKAGLPDYEGRVSIDALGENGPEDWPLLTLAQEACHTHAERMRSFGESPAVAAAFIARNCDIHDFRKVG